MILLPLILVAILSWSSMSTLHDQWVDWNNTTHTHGYLILSISVWMLWRNTHSLSRHSWQPCLRAAPLFALVAIAWVFSVQAALQLPELALIPVLFWLAILVAAGETWAARTVFAAGYLWFATPVWEVLNGPLQWATIYAVRCLLRLVGIPALFEGNIVQIPSGAFEIAGGCSGLHFFVVALSIGALLGELRGDGIARRLKLLALAAMLALVTNWIRVFTIVVLGHTTHMQHYIVAESHYTFGWLLFAGAMAVFFVIERRISSGPAPFVYVPAKVSPRWGAKAGILMLISLVAGFAVWNRLASRPFTGNWPADVVPDGWFPAPTHDGLWKPRFEGVDSEQVGIWQDGKGNSVERYVGLYRRQLQGKELSDVLNAPYGRQSPDGWQFDVRYSIDGREFQSPSYAQLWYALRALSSFRAPPSVVRVLRSSCEPDCIAAEHQLRRWRHLKE